MSGVEHRTKLLEIDQLQTCDGAHGKRLLSAGWVWHPWGVVNLLRRCSLRAAMDSNWHGR
jgi:hypothetical protein